MSDTELEQPSASSEVDDRHDDDRHDGPIPDDVENPWHGIPRELLGDSRSYDPDTAGGCG
jgi:hypothetical protein